MKSIAKVLILILTVSLLVCTFSGCDKDAHVLMSSKCSMYVVNSNGSETISNYTITTVYSDGTNTIECYSPSGTLWYTIHADGTTYTNDYTSQIRQEQDAACGIMALIGTNSTDLVYEVKENSNGFTTDECFSTKSGTYPAIHLVYEQLIIDATK